MDTDKLIGRREGPVGHVVFNNPAKHNAVSLEMWERLHDVLAGFAADEEVRVVVVTGAGEKAFIAGADISKFESERSDSTAAARYSEISSRAYDALYYFPKPTIAKIRGYCIGGGATVAAFCDMRFCDETAKFGVPAAKRALGYGFESLRRVSEVIGIPRTLEMLYTARQFDAREAYDMGLVNRLVPGGELDKLVADTAATIAENAPMTIALAKAAVREIGKPESQRNHARLAEMVKACFDSQDYTEATRSFMEKRKPKFIGR